MLHLVESGRGQRLPWPIGHPSASVPPGLREICKTLRPFCLDPRGIMSDDVCTLAPDLGEYVDALVGRIGWSGREMGVSAEIHPRS